MKFKSNQAILTKIQDMTNLWAQDGALTFDLTIRIHGLSTDDVQLLEQIMHNYKSYNLSSISISNEKEEI